MSYPRTSGIVHAPFQNPPGFLSVEAAVASMRGAPKLRGLTKEGKRVNQARDSVQDLIDAMVLFCGTPDQVHEQIAQFVAHCGGLGNLLMMGQAGAMTHADTVANLTLFSREVLPRLGEITQPDQRELAERARGDL